MGLVIRAKFFSKTPPGALQVGSNPQAVVFVDGIQRETTPFFDGKVEAGEHTVKVVPVETEGGLITWEGKVSVAPNILTVINRDLASSETLSSGDTMTLEKISDRNSSSLAVVSMPDQAVVRVNGEPKDFTPVLVEDLTPGDYQVVVSSPGYRERTVLATTIIGYKLTINVKLAQEMEVAQEESVEDESKEGESSSDEEKSEEGEEELQQEADEDEEPGGPSPAPPAKPYVEIIETPTGWLRVRDEPSTESEELAKVEPGQMFPYLEEEENGWYLIEYEDDKEGWVSGVYVDLVD